MEHYNDTVTRLRIEHAVQWSVRSHWEEDDLLVRSHTNYLADGTGKSSHLCMRQAVKELTTVKQLFPVETDPNTLLALTAFFSYACGFDDLIESLSTTAAQHTLTKARRLFGDHHKNNESNDSCPGLRLSHALYKHLELQMGTGQRMTKTCDAIDNLLCGMESELLYLNGREWDPETYLRIRQTTISFDPIYAIMDANLDLHGSSEVRASIQGLKDAVSLTAGLQNDILGLPKDVHNASLMNYIIVQYLRHSTGAPFPDNLNMEVLLPSLCLAIDRHNLEARQALEYYAQVKKQGTHEEEGFAKKIYVLMCTHLKWVTSSTRYGIRHYKLSNSEK